MTDLSDAGLRERAYEWCGKQPGQSSGNNGSTG